MGEQKIADNSTRCSQTCASKQHRPSAGGQKHHQQIDREEDQGASQISGEYKYPDMYNGQDRDQECPLLSHFAAQKTCQHQYVQDLDKLRRLECESRECIGDLCAVGGCAQQKHSRQRRDSEGRKNDSHVSQ